LAAGCAPVAPPQETLAGTSWQLVRFQGGDGKVLAPDDRSKYTLAFNADGRVAARLDCNRGTGSWKSAGQGQLELGPMAVTRAMCPPGSLDHEISKRLFHVRSYVMKNGRLFLSMMADGGVFELEPLR
jgi:para-nitrobenzyl esterase